MTAASAQSIQDGLPTLLRSIFELAYYKATISKPASANWQILQKLTNKIVVASTSDTPFYIGFDVTQEEEGIWKSIKEQLASLSISSPNFAIQATAPLHPTDDESTGKIVLQIKIEEKQQDAWNDWFRIYTEQRVQNSKLKRENQPVNIVDWHANLFIWKEKFDALQQTANGKLKKSPSGGLGAPTAISATTRNGSGATAPAPGTTTPIAVPSAAVAAPTVAVARQKSPSPTELPPAEKGKQGEHTNDKPKSKQKHEAAGPSAAAAPASTALPPRPNAKSGSDSEKSEEEHHHRRHHHHHRSKPGATPKAEAGAPQAGASIPPEAAPQAAAPTAESPHSSSDEGSETEPTPAQKFQKLFRLSQEVEITTTKEDERVIHSVKFHDKKDYETVRTAIPEDDNKNYSFNESKMTITACQPSWQRLTTAQQAKPAAPGAKDAAPSRAEGAAGAAAREKPASRAAEKASAAPAVQPLPKEALQASSLLGDDSSDEESGEREESDGEGASSEGSAKGNQGRGPVTQRAAAAAPISRVSPPPASTGGVAAAAIKDAAMVRDGGDAAQSAVPTDGNSPVRETDIAKSKAKFQERLGDNESEMIQEYVQQLKSFGCRLEAGEDTKLLRLLFDLEKSARSQLCWTPGLVDRLGEGPARNFRIEMIQLLGEVKHIIFTVATAEELSTRLLSIENQHQTLLNTDYGHQASLHLKKLLNSSLPISAEEPLRYSWQGGR